MTFGDIGDPGGGSLMLFGMALGWLLLIGMAGYGIVALIRLFIGR